MDGWRLDRLVCTNTRTYHHCRTAAEQPAKLCVCVCVWRVCEAVCARCEEAAEAAAASRGTLLLLLEEASQRPHTAHKSTCMLLSTNLCVARAMMTTGCRVMLLACTVVHASSFHWPWRPANLYQQFLVMRGSVVCCCWCCNPWLSGVHPLPPTPLAPCPCGHACVWCRPEQSCQMGSSCFCLCEFIWCFIVVGWLTS